MADDGSKIECLRTALDSDRYFWYLAINIEHYLISLIRRQRGMVDRVTNFLELIGQLLPSNDQGYDPRYLMPLAPYLNQLLNEESFLTWTETNRAQWVGNLPTAYRNMSFTQLPYNLRHVVYVPYVREIDRALNKLKLPYQSKYDILATIIHYGLEYQPNNLHELLTYGIYHHPTFKVKTNAYRGKITIINRYARLAGAGSSKYFIAADGSEQAEGDPCAIRTDGVFKAQMDSSSRAEVDREIRLYCRSLPILQDLTQGRIGFSQLSPEVAQLVEMMLRYC